MTRQHDVQRLQRDRSEGRRLALEKRQREAELLVAQVCDALAQRDAVTAEMERRAGRLLVEIKALGWPPVRATARHCGVSLHEVLRLRRLAEAVDEPDGRPAAPPTLDGHEAGE